MEEPLDLQAWASSEEAVHRVVEPAHSARVTGNQCSDTGLTQVNSKHGVAPR